VRWPGSRTWDAHPSAAGALSRQTERMPRPQRTARAYANDLRSVLLGYPPSPQLGRRVLYTGAHYRARDHGVGPVPDTTCRLLENSAGRRSCLRRTRCSHRMQVAKLSPNELSRRVGPAKLNVLSYIESREAIFLELRLMRPIPPSPQLNGLRQLRQLRRRDVGADNPRTQRTKPVTSKPARGQEATSGLA
jgi:hypothetical protein